MSKQKGSAPRGAKKFPRYNFEFRLRAVRFHLEEGYSLDLLSEELGACKETLYKWVKRYRESGDDGLRNQIWSSKPKVQPPVKDKIISLKREDPTRGVKRISQLLKRIFFMQASSDTVRKTLHEEDLIEPPKKKRQRNIPKPRFFERATPNQMWQTDICTFRLAGKNAYLIGYIDDYSRYIIGLGLFRSQTAEHVIETYRVASGEYGVPKEMLTDNGRQYTNWRGTTKFEKELKKDRIKHIKSQPHHPMTLGKIERFWKTILQEFLMRGQFVSFEDARDRLNFWVKYYNHRRPHQGIGGLCPADRFFEIQHELRQVLEQGVEENALEMALRGKPVNPFYMVGRMGDQNVVIRAEKGKVRMMVDGEEKVDNQELVYQMEKENIKDEKQNYAKETQDLQFTGKEQSGVVDLVGTPDDDRTVQGTVSDFRPVEQVAASGDGRDAVRPGVEERPGAASGIEQPVGPSAGEENFHAEWPSQPAGRTVGDYPAEPQQRGLIPVESYEKEIPTEAAGHHGHPACGDHYESPQRNHDCYGSSPGTGGVPQDLLQVGEAGPCRPAGWSERPGDGASGDPRHPTGGGGAGTPACRTPSRERPTAPAVRPQDADPRIGYGPIPEADEKKMSFYPESSRG